MIAYIYIINNCFFQQGGGGEALQLKVSNHDNTCTPVFVMSYITAKKDAIYYFKKKVLCHMNMMKIYEQWWINDQQLKMEKLSFELKGI